MLLRINRVDTTKLRNDAHFQFITEFMDMVTRTGAEQLKIKPLIDRLVPLHHQEDEVVKKINKSAITKHIQDSDKARDDTWNGIVGIVKAYTRHFNPTVRESARKLMIIIDTYGRIDKKNYKEQTSATYNVIQDFNKLPADVTAITGLSDWITQLQNQNSAFSDLMTDRNDEEAAKCNIELKGLRASIDELYNACRNFINSSIMLEGTENYEVFIRTWNVNVAKYNMIIKGKKRNNSDDGDSQDDTDSDPQQGDET